MINPATLSAAERNRLVCILGRLGSAHDGQRAAAGLLASRLLAGKGLQWGDVVREVGGQPHPQRPDAPSETAAAWQDQLGLCCRHAGHLSAWEHDFILSLSIRRQTVTPAQAAKLDQIADALRARGCA